MNAPAPSPERDALVPWFRSWFGEEYLHLYPHRDQEEADQAVELLLRQPGKDDAGKADRWPDAGRGADAGQAANASRGADVERGAGRRRVLDLGCGAGRHLRALAAAGLRPVGMDLSLPLLREARKTAPGCPRVRGDMRHLPFADASFDIVTSFFTSFGYFDSDMEDRKVLVEMDRVLAPDGRILLDFLNAEQVRTTLEPRDERMVDGKLVVQLRRLVDDGRRVEKRIRIRGRGVEEDFVERVRLYDAAELEELLDSVGLRVEARFGNYAGDPPGAAAPREILLACRTPSRPWPSRPWPSRP